MARSIPASLVVLHDRMLGDHPSGAEPCYDADVRRRRASNQPLKPWQQVLRQRARPGKPLRVWYTGKLSIDDLRALSRQYAMGQRPTTRTESHDGVDAGSGGRAACESVPRDSEAGERT